MDGCLGHAQAVMGSLVKRVLAPQLLAAAAATTGGASSAAAATTNADEAYRRLYHVSVMPCYDKKLEASRDELYAPGTDIPEVRKSSNQSHHGHCQAFCLCGQSVFAKGW